MNVLTDFHHAGLLHSFILLFEKRLGYKVFRPIGEEWFNEGYWKVYNHPATVKQFLGVNGATPDNSERLNDVISENNGVYLCKDIDSRETNRGITLEAFRKTNFGIVIASIPQHIEPFKRLAEEHWARPKFIFQIGNQWSDDYKNIDNIMASANVSVNSRNSVVYHQEFDLNVFSRGLGDVVKPRITSFVNCFSLDDMFRDDWELFLNVEKKLPDWEFKALGGSCRDGTANGEYEVADNIKNSAFVWHTKRGGDGYGHIIHNAGACGVPLIVKKQYYEGKMGEVLMRDGETCITVDNLSVDEIVNKIKYYSIKDNWKRMSNNIYEAFKFNVNFENEEKIIRHFLAKLI